MMLEQPYPEFDEILTSIGEAGRWLAENGASEGAAGNISVYLGWPVEPRGKFPVAETIDLPQPVPELAGKTLIVTGAGRRLREIIQNPLANLGCLVIEEGGDKARLYTSPRRLFTQLTSEFNSHLAVHVDQVDRSGTNFHAVVHAQPPHLTYLSNIPCYQDTLYLNRHLLRWQPELIIQFPEGIGYLPFRVPGSPELMADTVSALSKYRIVLWGKHGVMARSDSSVKRASDRIEYAEAAARYEYMNLVVGEVGEGLLPGEIRAICKSFNIQQTIF